MKVLQSSFFRALCAIVVGALLIKYREETVTWITIAIGVLFFVSGVISCASYLSARRHADDPQVFDTEGRQLTGLRPVFPIVGLGSLILGVILALMPGTFITSLVYVLAAILILGAVGQFVSLAAANKHVRLAWGWWVMPSILLIVGIVAVVRPQAIATAPLFVIGWAMMAYGAVEVVNALKIHRIRKHAEQEAAHATEAATDSGESAPTGGDNPAEEQPTPVD